STRCRCRSPPQREHFQNILSEMGRGARHAMRGCAQHGSEAFVKKYIREMIDDLRRPKTKKYTPPVPPVVPQDLNNQILSKDQRQRTKQLDFQAQQSEERQQLP